MSMNGLDDTPEALIAYVKACGIDDPQAWLEARIPNWKEPAPHATETELFSEIEVNGEIWEVWITELSEKT